jgi:hypothetical protein
VGCLPGNNYSEHQRLASRFSLRPD